MQKNIKHCDSDTGKAGEKSVHYTQIVIKIKGSKFLAEVFPCHSDKEARALIKSQKEKYKSATHLVHAFITGGGSAIMGKSDNGEPAGTAGGPMLNVLKGSGYKDLLVTVARWFGGTKLGTGGLVKAYSGCVKEVLKIMEGADI